MRNNVEMTYKIAKVIDPSVSTGAIMTTWEEITDKLEKLAGSIPYLRIRNRF